MLQNFSLAMGIAQQTNRHMDSTGKLNRGQMLGLLRTQQIPSVIVDGDKISGAMSKAVLRTIDDHGQGCWASAATIGRETCLSERTVRRAINALEDLGLVGVESRPGQPKVIRIQWQNFDVTPEALSEVESCSTPEALSITPEALSDTPEALDNYPGSTVRQSVKKRNRNVKKRNTAKSSSTNVDESLLAWIQFWNEMKSKGIVTGGASETPSEGVKTGWKRVQASKPLQKLLSDKQAIESKIREQPFLLGSWFSLPKLFGGKNRDGEHIAAKIMDGGYASTGKPSGRTVSYTGQYDPNLPIGDF